MGASAHAEGFFDFFDPSPQRIEGQLQRAGYELRAPLARHGDVYIGDVLAANGVHERLVIDAHTTKIVARYPAHGRGWRDVAPDADFGDSPFGAPRPPRGVGPRQAQVYDDFGPVRRPGEPDIFARADPSAPPGGFFDDPAAGGGGYIDRPKPKPHVMKPKVSSIAPAAKAPPTAAEPAPSAAGSSTPPAVNAAPEASAPAPAESPKAAPSHVDAPAPVAEAVKPLAEAKPVAQAAAPAPQPRPAAKTKALNDLPVTPLD